MKKITLTSIAVFVGVMMFAAPTFAATTATLSPANINVTIGKQFIVSVSVNPQGASNFAEKLEINYPASTLEVLSFNLGGNWTALTQPGYDSIDNTSGILIKTAGYPGGFTSATTFGTITFRAKKTGTGIIKIGSQSIAFTANTQDPISGTVSSVTVAAAPVTPVKAPSELSPSASDTVQTTEQTASSSEEIAQPTPIIQTQTVAVSNAAVPGASNAWKWIVGIIILAAVGYGAYIFVKKGKQN